MTKLLAIVNNNNYKSKHFFNDKQYITMEEKHL